MRSLGLLFSIMIPSVAVAATIHVPGDQPTIQAGIDAAACVFFVRLEAGGESTTERLVLLR